MNRASALFEIAVNAGYIDNNIDIVSEYNDLSDDMDFEDWLVQKGYISKNEATKLATELIILEQNADSKIENAVLSEPDKKNEIQENKLLEDSVQKIEESEIVENDEIIEDVEVYEIEQPQSFDCEYLDSIEPVEATILEEKEESEDKVNIPDTTIVENESSEFARTIVDENISHIKGGDVWGNNSSSQSDDYLEIKQSNDLENNNQNETEELDTSAQNSILTDEIAEPISNDGEFDLLPDIRASQRRAKIKANETHDDANNNNAETQDDEQNYEVHEIVEDHELNPNEADNSGITILKLDSKSTSSNSHRQKTLAMSGTKTGFNKLKTKYDSRLEDSDTYRGSTSAESNLLNGSKISTRNSSRSSELFDDFQKDIPPGTILAGCRIESRIGEGGMGVVYRAQHLGLERTVAIKVLPRQLVEKPTQFQRFQAEARVIAKLEHPNIVQVHHFGLKNGNPFIVMQWLDGQSLGEKIAADGKLPLDEALEIIIQSAKGLAAAHAEGVIHRDVKPDNVFINPNGNVKILDFGLAKEVEADVKLSQAGAFLGTPHYVAPEQAWSDTEITQAADIYSLGITAFEMLTGEPPFTGSLYQILSAHATAPLPSIAAKCPEIPIEFEDLILEMTAKKPDDRPPSISEIADRLELIKISRNLLKDPKLKSKLGKRILELEKVAGEAEARRMRRLRGESRKKIAKYVGISMIFLAAIAIIVSISLFVQSGTGNQDVGEYERKRFEQIAREYRLANDADSASKVIYSLDDFISSVSSDEFKEKAQSYKKDMLKLFEQESKHIENAAVILLNKSHNAQTETEARKFLGEITQFSRKYPVLFKTKEWVTKFDKVKENLNEIIVQAVELRKVQSEFETLYEKADITTEATKAKLVIEDIKIFAEQYKSYQEFVKKLNSIQLKLEKIISTAEEEAFNERKVVELLNRAVNTIDYALALFIMDEINKFLDEKPQFKNALEPGIENLNQIISDGEIQLEKQRKALRLQQQAKIVADADKARILLDQISEFISDAKEFKLSLEPSIQRLLRLISSAENKALLLKERDEILEAARSVVEYRAGQKVLEKIERFLLKAPEFKNDLSGEKARIENIIYNAATFIAQERQAQALLNEARNFVKIETEQEIEKAKEMLNELENFRLKYPAQSSKIETTINWLSAIITSKTITPPEVIVPADVNQKPWQTMNFQEKGNFKLRKIAGVYRFRHADKITDLSISKDGKWLISASTDNSIKIWEAATGLEVKTLAGHIAPVLCIAANNDFTKIASGSDDNTCKVWDAITGQELLSLTGHTDAVTTVAFDSSGKNILTGSQDKTAILWDSTRQDKIRTFNNSKSAVTSAIISEDGEFVIVGDKSGLIIVYDIFSGNKIRDYSEHRSSISAITVTSDGKIISASESGAIKIWEINTAKTLKTISEHKMAVLGLNLSKDEKYLVSNSADMTSIVWDFKTFKKRGMLTGHRHYVSGGVFGRNNKFIYTSSWDTTIKRWYFSNFEEKPVAGTPHLGPIIATDVTSDGKFSATGSVDGVLVFWDKELNVVWANTMPDNTSISSVLIMGGYVAAGTREHLYWFDMNNGKLIPNKSKEPNNADEQNNKIIQDVDDGKTKTNQHDFSIYQDSFTDPENLSLKVTSLAKSAESTILIVGLLNGQLRVWDRILDVWYKINPQAIDGTIYPIIDVECTKDSKIIIATTATKVFILKFSENAKKYVVIRTHLSTGSEIFRSLAVNRAGDKLLIAGGTLKIGFLTVFDLADTDASPTKYKVHTALTTKAAFLSEGKILTMSREQEFKVWDIRDMTKFIFNIDCRLASEISDTFGLCSSKSNLIVAGHRGTVLWFTITPPNGS